MIVSDTSPIVSLAMIGQVSLLRGVYGSVSIPCAVRDEVLAGDGKADGCDLGTLEWLHVRPVVNANVTRVLRLILDPGEADAIALALEVEPHALLVDERKARKVATQLGIAVVGTLDVLCAAKANGQIPAVRPLLDDLINRARFRVSKTLYHKVLVSVGEEHRMRVES